MRKTPVVMGVLSMVFGGITALITLVSLASAPFSKKMLSDMGDGFARAPHKEGMPDMKQAFASMAKVTEELKLYTYLTSFVMLAFSIALIVVGWLLYKRRAQARPFTIAWATGALVYLPVQIYVQVKIILPRTMEVTKQMVASDAAASSMMQVLGDWQGPLTVVVDLLCYAPFPLLLLWLIGRPSTKNDLVAVP